MKKSWFYLINTFLVNTAKSFGKMLKIGNDHVSRLTAEMSDAIIESMHDAILPEMVRYRKFYSDWKSSDNLCGQRIGHR